MINVIKDNIQGWNGYRLSAGNISIGLVPDVGGRLMSFQINGEELLYAHPPESGHVYDIPDAKDLDALKTRFGFHIIGGDKAWVAPEWEWVARIPPLDLDLGRYSFEMKDGTCTMISPVCRETGLKVIRRITLKGNGVLYLRDEFYNTTTRSLQKGIWAVVQIPKPFDVYVPAGESGLRSYHLQDASLPQAEQEVLSIGGWQKVPVHSSVCFKFGGVIKAGRLVVLTKKQDHVVGLMWSFPVSLQVKDYVHASSVEIFNSSLFPYGEVEMHSVSRVIEPEGCISFERTLCALSMPVEGENDPDKFLMPMVDILDK